MYMSYNDYIWYTVSHMYNQGTARCYYRGQPGSLGQRQRQMCTWTLQEHKHRYRVWNKQISVYYYQPIGQLKNLPMVTMSPSGYATVNNNNDDDDNDDDTHFYPAIRL